MSSTKIEQHFKPGTPVVWHRVFGDPLEGEVVETDEWSHTSELRHDSFIVDYGDRLTHHRIDRDCPVHRNCGTIVLSSGGRR